MSALKRAIALSMVFTALMITMSGCGFHPGGDAIAFLRGGAVWTVQPDGSNHVFVAGNTVVSFSWSPNHHELVFRAGASARLAAEARPPLSTLGAPDAPSILGVASINGSSTLQISPDQDATFRGDAWWDPSGHRLLYADYFDSANPVHSYIESQADQPAGIASARVANTSALPVLSPDGKTIAIIDDQGTVRIGSALSQDRTVTTGALTMLPQVGRPARLLWQPRRNALLYAITAPAGVSLVLSDLSGARKTVIGTSPVILDYAFSPDGATVAVRTPDAIELWNAGHPGAPATTVGEGDPYVLVWWSPNSALLLIQDHAGWRMLDARTGMVTDLVAYANPVQDTPGQPITSWHPAAASPWSGDGSRFVFAAAAATWRGAPMTAPTTGEYGLYVADPRADTARPQLIDSGPDQEPSWTYADPSTTFLVAG